MHIKEYNDAMKFFRTYDSVASKGKWKDFVDEMKFDSMLQEPRTMAHGGRIPFGDGSPRKIYKVIRPITTQDRKMNLDIPKDAKYKVQLPKGEVGGTSTTMKYTTTEAQANKAIKDAELRWKNYERPKKDIIPDNPADYAEDVRTRKNNVGLKKISIEPSGSLNIKKIKTTLRSG